MGRRYTVATSAIDAYKEKVLHDGSHLTRREIEHRISNLLKGVIPDSHGLYPVNIRNGKQNSFYLMMDPTNIYRIIDVLTVEEVKALS